MADKAPRVVAGADAALGKAKCSECVCSSCSLRDITSALQTTREIKARESHRRRISFMFENPWNSQNSRAA